MHSRNIGCTAPRAGPLTSEPDPTRFRMQTGRENTYVKLPRKDEVSLHISDSVSKWGSTGRRKTLNANKVQTHAQGMRHQHWKQWALYIQVLLLDVNPFPIALIGGRGEDHRIFGYRKITRCSPMIMKQFCSILTHPLLTLLGPSTPPKKQHR